jgi:hypothetical protein
MDATLNENSEFLKKSKGVFMACAWFSCDCGAMAEYKGRKHETCPNCGEDMYLECDEYPDYPEEPEEPEEIQ